MSEQTESQFQIENRPQIPVALRAAGWMIVLSFIAVLLHQGRSLFIPLVIAGIGVYFIFMLERLIQRIRIGNWKLPSVVALIIAFAIVIGAGYIIVSIISNNVTYVMRAAPEYQERLTRFQNNFGDRMGGAFERMGIPLPSLLQPFSPSATNESQPPHATNAVESPSSTPAEELLAANETQPAPATNAIESISTTTPEKPTDTSTNEPDSIVPTLTLGQLFDLMDISFVTIITSVGKNLTALLQTTTLILILGIFIFMEAYFVPKKIQALFPDQEKRSHVEKILRRIDGDVQTYFGIKTLISLVTALACYIVMRLVGLDFAAFWALLIFILNFIPAIGSIIATALPALLALVQFHDNFAFFLVVLLGVAAIQVFFGNFLEPNLMGVTLNLSPLVVVLSLIAWGLIWGIVGMFLCVPITVIIVIILANFPGTRWIAVLLSRKGDLRL